MRDNPQFDIGVVGHPQTIKVAAMVLLMREDLPNGSSFAICSYPPGKRTLYMSNASKEYLAAQSPEWAEVLASLEKL